MQEGVVMAIPLAYGTWICRAFALLHQGGPSQSEKVLANTRPHNLISCLGVPNPNLLAMIDSVPEAKAAGCRRRKNGPEPPKNLSTSLRRASNFIVLT